MKLEQYSCFLKQRHDIQASATNTFPISDICKTLTSSKNITPVSKELSNAAVDFIVCHFAYIITDYQ